MLLEEEMYLPTEWKKRSKNGVTCVQCMVQKSEDAVKRTSVGCPTCRWMRCDNGALSKREAAFVEGDSIEISTKEQLRICSSCRSQYAVHKKCDVCKKQHARGNYSTAMWFLARGGGTRRKCVKCERTD